MLNLNRLPAGTSLLNWNSELPSSGTGDPLGMTLRVGARLGAELLHCITSITPRARYYSFYPWSFQRAHEQLGDAASLSDVMRLVLIDERAMTLGAVLHHDGRACNGGSLQGSKRAIEYAAERSARAIDLGKWNHLRDNTSGFEAYKGSLINLGLFEETGKNDTEGHLADEEQTASLSSGKLSALGRNLALAFGSGVEGARFGGLKLDSATLELDLLEEFGAAAGLCELRLADSFDLLPLRNLFFAAGNNDEFNSHFRRRMSLLLILYSVDVAADNGMALDGEAFNDLTYYRTLLDEDDNPIPIDIPWQLTDISERWRIFHFHGYLTTALEALLVGLVRAIRYHPEGRTVGETIEAFDSLEARSLLSELLSVELPVPFMDHTPASSLALLGIDYPNSTEDNADASAIFGAMPAVERQLSDALIDKDFVSGAAGPLVATLLLFALLLRHELTVDESHKGWNAQKVVDPFSDVGLPTVVHSLKTEIGNDWWNRPNGEVIARLLNRFVIRQHETMSYEKGFGGSPPFFRFDGRLVVGTDTIAENVGAGNPRFPSAMQVLRDLRLIGEDDAGGESLTPDGRNLLDRLLNGVEA